MADEVATTPAQYAWNAPTDLCEAVAGGATVDVVYVHLPFAGEVEASGGIDAHTAFMQQAIFGLRHCLQAMERRFGIQRWPVDDLVLWVADLPSRLADPGGDELERWLGSELRRCLSACDLPPEMLALLTDLSIGHQRMRPPRGEDPLRAYARALRDAQRGACDPLAREQQRSADLMERALLEKAFVFHYQPIVDVHSGSVIAHEALCRGTLDALRFPDVIFGTAERTHKIWDLGRLLRELLAVRLDRLSTERDQQTLLFLNVHPDDIEDPTFLEQALSGSLSRHARRIVVELTERAAIRDYRRVKAFFATLRRHGFRLAIDDLGSGYAGLTALAELEPDYIKFDMGLIRDLHLHPVKQRLIERMQGFAEEIRAETISEGVECAEERDALLDAGCRVMQGYYFGRPAPGFVEVPSERFPERRASVAAQPLVS